MCVCEELGVKVRKGVEVMWKGVEVRKDVWM